MRKIVLWIYMFFLATNQNIMANETIYNEAKVVLKMIEKRSVEFISAEDSSFLIKGSKIFDIHHFYSADTTGDMPCTPFYACPNRVANYLSLLGVEKNRSLVLYDNSYSIYASALYIMLESIGYKSMIILNGGADAIYRIDPNQKIYDKYKREIDKLIKSKNEENSTKGFKLNELKIEELRKKLEVIKPYLLTQKNHNIVLEKDKIEYKIDKLNLDYLLSRDDLKEAVRKVRDEGRESNITIVDVCPMVDIVGSKNGSYIPGVIPLSWKKVVNHKDKKILNDEKLLSLFELNGLDKNSEQYLYCMSGSDKALFVMTLLREVGYSKVKSFTGDWNVWIGGVDEK